MRICRRNRAHHLSILDDSNCCVAGPQLFTIFAHWEKGISTSHHIMMWEPIVVKNSQLSMNMYIHLQHLYTEELRNINNDNFGKTYLMLPGVSMVVIFFLCKNSYPLPHTFDEDDELLLHHRQGLLRCALPESPRLRFVP